MRLPQPNPAPNQTGRTRLQLGGRQRGPPVTLNVLDLTKDASMENRDVCELCVPESVLAESELAYVRLERNSLSRGHVVVVPRRHVADFFEMTSPEQMAVVELLNSARALIQSQYSPDGYNIGVNIGRAAGQSRMHVHVHLIPRHAGDVPNPAGGIRCVLAGKRAA
jgi:diadenosine tetraphosphate (Ap4A) HIT family hydrolase